MILSLFERLAGIDSTRHSAISKRLVAKTSPLKMPTLHQYPLSVKSSGDYIHITGLNVNDIKSDSAMIFGPIVGNAIFHKTSNSHKTVILRYFAFELYNIVDFLIELRRDDIIYKLSLKRLHALRDIIHSDTWLSTVDKPKDDILSIREIEKKLSWKPFDYQSDFLTYYNDIVPRYNLNGTIAAMAAGTGKTAAAFFLSVSMKVDVTIILSPKIAIGNVWEKTLRDIYKVIPKYYTSLDPGKPKDSDRYIIINYEKIQWLIEQSELFKNKKILVVIDESHNFNEETAKRTELLREFVHQQHAKTVSLSGTFLKAMPKEMIPILKLIDPYFNKEAERAFRMLFKRNRDASGELLARRIGITSYKVEKSAMRLLESRTTYHHIKVRNSKRYTLEAVKDRMRIYMEKRLKEIAKTAVQDKLTYDSIIAEHEPFANTTDLTSYKEDVIAIRGLKNYFHHGELLKRVNLYEKEVIKPTISKESWHVFSKLKSIVKYPSLVVVGEALGKVLGRARIECNMAISRAFDYSKVIESTKKKTVIFSNSVDVIEDTVDRLTGSYDPLVVYGKHTSNIDNIVDDFNNVPSANPLAATYLSLSTAVPLIAADQMIFIDLPYRPHILEQAKARIARTGATTRAHFHYLQLDTDGVANVSTRNKDILAWARDVVEDLTGVVIGEMPEDPNPPVAKESFLTW